MGSGYKDFAPGDVLTAANVDGYLMRQTVMTFADASARNTALSGVLDEGMVAYLEDSNIVTVYDGSAWQTTASAAGKSYEIVKFTSSGSFSKGSYPWATTARIRVVGGGGGSGGCLLTDNTEKTSLAGGGGGGGYAEADIALSAMGSSETVTVGAGGAAGTTSGGGGTGVTTSFGSLVVAAGGVGGAVSGTQDNLRPIGGAGGAGGAGSTGDLLISGSGGYASTVYNGNTATNSPGGASQLSGSQTRKATEATIAPEAGVSFGGGASGGANQGGSASAAVGAAGAVGIVIVELFG